MSSRKVTNITDAVVIVANDLRTGRTVYLAADGSWHLCIDSAEVLRVEDDAQARLLQSLSDPKVLDPYLVNTNAQGQPQHIREVIRNTGPTIDAINDSFIGDARVSV